MRLAVVLALLGCTVYARPTREALCSYGTSNYSLSWEFDELSNDVVFRLTATSPAHNFWTGVYFGEEEPFDAIGVFVRNGQIGLVDAFLPPATEATVIADEQTNVQSLQFDMIEGRLTAEFARPLSSHDNQDSDLSKCTTFFFPEAEEITRSGQITLPTMSMSRRVCNIARNCPVRRANRHHAEQFKRSENKEEVPAEAAAPEIAPLVEAEQEGELEKKEAPAAPTCNWEHEGAKVNWRLENGKVIFTVNQDNKKGKWWSAFGVGETMENLRAVLVFSENGKVKKLGAFQTQGYEIPEGLEYEPELISAKNGQGKAAYEFAASAADLFPNADFTQCVTLQVGFYAGKYGQGFKVLKHETAPSPINACNIDKCGAPQAAEIIEENEASGLEAEGSGEAAQEGLLFNPFAQEQPKTEQPLAAPAVTEAAPLSAAPVVPVIPENQPEIKKEEAPVIATEAPIQAEAPKEEKKAEEVKRETEAPKQEEKPVTEAPKEEGKKEEEKKTEEAQAAPVEEKKEEIEGSGIEEPKKEENKAQEEPLLHHDSTPTPEEMIKEMELGAATTIVAPTVNGECSAEHKDLRVCTSYFADYLGKVEEWAKNHEQTLGSQMWKACTLLSEVKHVPTMCCTIFRETCAQHIKV